ncbi:MAG: hypothetical protein JWN68_886 [Nocardioides sp.]|jgi:polyhydroxyalkanoate synthesis regulator phasin|uniref:hypothetical protein n=1 Tax=Nocardioides sp. TaxID=35761 RepID=UPI0026150434|nr:hypothetical protein [Nocardioides sp.]MCW2832933.1 hypothetical protein [Nocardioides sp.]
MDEAARDETQAEIESLQDFLDDKRVAQQALQEEADKEAARITELESELADLQAQGEPA